MLWRQGLNAPVSLAVPKPVETADVKLPRAVSMPITVAECREIARMWRDVLGCDDEKNAAVARSTEWEKCGEQWPLQSQCRKICGALWEDAGKDANKRTIARRLVVLVGVVGIRETLWRWNLDDVTDARSFTCR